MPPGRLLVGIGDVKERLLAKVPAEELHAHRQSVDESGRHGDARHAGDIGGEGADIAEVHLEGIVRFFPYPEGDGGGGGGHQGVELLEGGV